MVDEIPVYAFKDTLKRIALNTKGVTFVSYVCIFLTPHVLS